MGLSLLTHLARVAVSALDQTGGKLIASEERVRTMNQEAIYIHSRKSCSVSLPFWQSPDADSFWNDSLYAAWNANHWAVSFVFILLLISVLI